MTWMEKGIGNGKESDHATTDNGLLKETQPCTSPSASLAIATPVQNGFEEKDALSCANVLRSRNNVLEKDSGNVEAHIGKGICMQSKGRLAFGCFAEAIRLDPQNACALTHCGILYKEEGRLVEAAELCSSELSYFSFSYQKALRAVIQTSSRVPYHCFDRSWNQLKAC
ncbi:hypothetical protein ACFE04_002139 [Oxalis oulophora]